MTAMLLLFFYGLSCLGATVNFFAWCRMFRMRLRDPSRRAFLDDTFLLTRTGLTMLSLGISGLSGVRLYGSLFRATKIEVPLDIGIVFIALMACAEPMLLRVSEVHARARGTRSISWMIYWIAAVSWLVCVVSMAADFI